MNKTIDSPTQSPTISKNDTAFFILIAFIDVAGMVFLYYLCSKIKLLKYFNRNKVEIKINFNRYFIDNMIDIEDEDLCSICLSNFDDKDVKILKCNHFFHNECIIEWLKVKEICPNCKVNLKSIVNT